jgi:hypothetical protein
MKLYIYTKLMLQLSTVAVVFGGIVALLCVHCFFVVFEVCDVQLLISEI